MFRSKEKYAIKLTGGRGGLLYEEMGKQLNIDSEFTCEPRGIYIYSDSMKLWNNSIEPITKEDIDRIVYNLRVFFEKDGYVVYVV